MEESKILSCAWMWSEGSGDTYVFPKEALLGFAKELLSLSRQENSKATPPAQGGREEPEVVAYRISHPGQAWKVYEQRQDWAYQSYGHIRYEVQDLMTVAQHERIVSALCTRPAQKADEIGTSEQQPVAYADPQALANFEVARKNGYMSGPYCYEWMHAHQWRGEIPLFAAPQPEQKQSELVEALQAFVALSEERLRELGELSPEMTKCLHDGHAALAAQEK